MHIVIDARIRRASTGRPVDRFLKYIQTLDKQNTYTILLEPGDPWKPTAKTFKTVVCPYKQFSFNPLQQITYARMLYRLKPDVVYFTLTGQQPLFFFGKQVTLTHDLTMLRHVRAGKLPIIAHAIRMLGYRLLFWAAHRKAKTIIVPSNFVKEDLSTHYPFAAAKITVAYEASEPPISGKAVQPQHIEKPFILHVGSPLPHKNIEGLVEAFEKIHESRPTLQLVLAGKKEYYFKQLQKQIDLSPARDNIITPGFVSSAELKWLYQNASAYVLPSLSEGFGLPGLEAMVHGCPLASSDATCLPEIYGNAAYYFDPLNIGDMVSRINELLANSQLRQRLVKNGYTQVKKYSWKEMTKQMFEVYKII